MLFKILQLNINSDNYWNKLIPYLTSHDFDVIHLQEVTGKNTVAGNIHSKLDCFKELQQVLSGYNAEFVIVQRYLSDPINSYMANATFYNRQFSLLEKKDIILHSNPELFPPYAKNYENVGRIALHLKLKIGETQVSFINAHPAWAHTPKEEPHQTKQAKILISYLQMVPRPFIVSGDLNLNPDQPTIKKLNTITRNLIEENNITNTLNPRTHRAKALFPDGAAVDYIFVTPDVTVKKFSVIEADFSDHFGLTAVIEI